MSESQAPLMNLEQVRADLASFDTGFPPVDNGRYERLVDEITGGERDIVELAQALAASEPRPFLPPAWGDGRSPYELDELDDDDRESVRHGALLVLASGYVGESEWSDDEGDGEDEGDEEDDDKGIGVGLDRVFDYTHDFDRLVEKLSVHYGEPVIGHDELRSSDEGKAAHWRAGESTVVLQVYVNYPGGNIELHLWLAAVAGQIEVSAVEDED